MRKSILVLIVCVLSCVTSFDASAAIPQEQAFLDSYRKALESNDIKTLEGFLYTKDADPEALEYFKSSLPLEEGFKVAQLELVDVTPEEVAQAIKPMKGPDGTLSALPIKPAKKLIIKVESKEPGENSLTDQRALGEVNGKLMILVPAIVKK